MENKKIARIREKDRTILQEVIPLETPIHLFIDPSAACNFKCKFCFNRNKKNKLNSTVMKIEMFKKIVNDLKQFPDKLKVLRLYKEGEPLINKKLPEMIYYAKQEEVCEKIDFTTNGALLIPSKINELVNSGVDAINISVEGINERAYLDIAGVKIDFKNFVDNIKYLYKHKGNCRIHIKTTDVNVLEDDREKFYNIFSEYCDEISIEQIAPIWPNTDISNVKKEFSKDIYNHQVTRLEICPYIFYSLTINSDGTVSSCFIDWEHKNILGNIEDKSVYDIWHGQELYAMRVAHLNYNRKCFEICSQCGQLVYGQGDNIDKYAQSILEKLNNRYIIENI